MIRLDMSEYMGKAFGGKADWAPLPGMSDMMREGKLQRNRSGRATPIR